MDFDLKDFHHVGFCPIVILLSHESFWVDFIGGDYVQVDFRRTGLCPVDFGKGDFSRGDFWFVPPLELIEA